MSTTTLISPRVLAGAAYLDGVLPGWDHIVNPDLLDLGSECRCVLGQLVIDHHTDNIANGSADFDPDDETLDVYDDGEAYGSTSPFDRWMRADDHIAPPLTLDQAIAYGFLAPAYRHPCVVPATIAAEHAALTADWQTLIAGRRQERAA